MATLRQTFSDIASAIRAKGISGQTMKPIDMASRIGEIRSLDGYGYLTFTAEEATTLTLNQNGDISPKLLKSSDGVNWVKWENPSTNGISLNVGQSVYIKADEDSSPKTTRNSFSSSKRISCSGDIRSLVKMIAPGDYFNWLSELFYNCTKLTKAPELPSTTLTDSCYVSMFTGCSSLTKAPELPATNLAESCYDSMFMDCTSLTTPPELPATTLADYCYQGMFGSCSSLTKAPELPATTLAYGCYSNMFYGCTSLKRIKMNASSGSWGSSMFYRCKSLELIDMTGSTGVPQLSNVNNFANTNDTYKIVVPDSLYDTWITTGNWASIASHIMKKSDWNASHQDDILP